MRIKFIERVIMNCDKSCLYSILCELCTNLITFDNCDKTIQQNEERDCNYSQAKFYKNSIIINIKLKITSTQYSGNKKLKNKCTIKFLYLHFLIRI